MTGAPGSKWSSVACDIRLSPEIDKTDESIERQYNSSSLNAPANHIGAYWDPGMEFGIDYKEWDKPFSGTGIKIIKSHTFSLHLHKLKKYKQPIVMVYRNDVECYRHWVLAGGFDITYPNYKPYYKDLNTMYEKIVQQNRNILDFVHDNSIHNDKNIFRVNTKNGLCNLLNLTMTGDDINYKDKDITVYVYQ